MTFENLPKKISTCNEDVTVCAATTAMDQLNEALGVAEKLVVEHPR